jgi:hypothetical protein
MSNKKRNDGDTSKKAQKRLRKLATKRSVLFSKETLFPEKLKIANEIASKLTALSR